jgi:hypothetical protein
VVKLSLHVDDFLCLAGNLSISSHVPHRKAPTWRDLFRKTKTIKKSSSKKDLLFNIEE